MKLKNILATGLIMGSLAGCSDSEYHYNGKIGEEQVIFYEKDYGDNFLEVARENGTIIKYVDNKSDDFKLEYVEITKSGVTTRYGKDAVGKVVLEEAQKQFDNYLKQILETKKVQGLEDISLKGDK
jgi:hypothetical protein